jgi:PiT family inorganic phosphate transporter
LIGDVQILLLVAILVAVAFDFTNGFHDTANAIATSVSTRALTPSQAVVISAVFNLVGALVTVNLFHAKVSNTIASTLAIKAGLVVVMAALVGAIAWNLLTWYLGLPSSSTHALIGGLVGAGIAAAGGFGAVKWASLGKQIIALITSPPIGFAVAGIFMTILLLLVYRGRPGPLNRAFRWTQVVAAAFVSFSHGGNDAQKTMAAIALALVATGHLAKFTVPDWVVLLSATAIAFGTYAGGWRIIRTLGWRIYKLEPATGLSAQLMAATVIQVASAYGLPVSTTHVVTGSVMGAGAARNLSALKWGVGANIVTAWLLTIPAAAVIGWVAFAILNTAGLRG